MLFSRVRGAGCGGRRLLRQGLRLLRACASVQVARSPLQRWPQLPAGYHCLGHRDGVGWGVHVWPIELDQEPESSGAAVKAGSRDTRKVTCSSASLLVPACNSASSVSPPPEPPLESRCFGMRGALCLGLHSVVAKWGWDSHSFFPSGTQSPKASEHPLCLARPCAGGLAWRTVSDR